MEALTKRLTAANVTFSLAGCSLQCQQMKGYSVHALSSIFISSGSCGAPAIDRLTFQPCPLILWHVRCLQVSGLWNILWDKLLLLLVFCHTTAFFLDGGDYSIPYTPFRVYEMGLKVWYCRQGVKCDYCSHPTMFCISTLPKFPGIFGAMNLAVFRRPFRTFVQAR